MNHWVVLLFKDSSYQTKFTKACECLEKDKEVLFTFYDFPAQHWSHLRTTNPVESTFATVRLRTYRTTGSGSRIGRNESLVHLRIPPVQVGNLVVFTRK